MPNVNACPICGGAVQDGEPRFYFPKLPSWHALSAYHGTVHIVCLRALPDKKAVSTTLADIYENFYGEGSATPIVAREGNLVVKDSRRDSASFDIYDFDDFAEFYIPMDSLELVQQLDSAHSVSLGVQGLQLLHREIDGTLKLERTKPHYVVDLPALTHEILVRCLSRARGTGTQ